MDEKDPIERKFKSALSDFSSDPPAEMWEELQLKLHPELKPAGIAGHFPLFSWLMHKPLVFYLTLTGIATGLILSVGYFGFRHRHDIRGHAYAGEVRLTGGTAALFVVADNIMPWDSVAYYRSAVLDHYGHFHFPGVREGRYILRITPDPHSETAQNYLPSWYDRFENSDSSRLIVIREGDVGAEVHLKRK